MSRAFRLVTLAAMAALGLGSAAFSTAQAQSPGQRSAQSDCEREAVRRGYVVISTRNYQQQKDGWSIDLQARDQAGRVSWGSCFVETRTGDVSLFGFGWGGSGAAAAAGTCSSSTARRSKASIASASCPSMGARGSSSRSRTHPASRARPGASEATGSGSTMVAVPGSRCRSAVPVVAVRASTSTAAPSNSAIASARCRAAMSASSSTTIRAASVATPAPGARATDWSGSTCGCKGRFELVRAGTGGGGGGGNAGQQQRAEVQCRNQATREGISVRFVEPADSARQLLGDDRGRHARWPARASHLPVLSSVESGRALLRRRVRRQRRRLEWWLRWQRPGECGARVLEPGATAGTAGIRAARRAADLRRLRHAAQGASRQRRPTAGGVLPLLDQLRTGRDHLLALSSRRISVANHHDRECRPAVVACQHPRCTHRRLADGSRAAVPRGTDMEVDAFSIAALLLLVGSLVAAAASRRRAARRRAEEMARARARRRKVPVVSANVRGLPSGESDLWVDDRNPTPRKGRAA